MEESKEVGETKLGYKVYLREGPMGPQYWCDEIGGGSIVFEPCIDNPEAVAIALAHYFENK